MADDVTGKGQGGRLPSRYMDPFQAFRGEMDRLFDDFLGGLPTFSNLRQSFPAAQVLTPALDVKETEKELVVKADLPGIDEKDVQLTIQDGVLTMRGEKKSERKDSARTTTWWSAATVRSSARSACPRPSTRIRPRRASTRAC